MKPSRNNFLHRESCPTLSNCSHPVSGFRPPVSVFTDQTGAPIQFMHYLPFGETWVDQRATNWNSRYTFSGKEKDEETGYGYFGARYYNSDWSIWLSVDPMADKYPSHSPYVYCGNNPIKLKDPNGEFPIETIWDIGNVIYDVGAAIFNHVKGNHKAARSNWADAGVDLLAVALPYIPAGSSKLLKIGARTLDAIGDKLKAGSQGQKMANKLMKYSPDGKIPTPNTDIKQFTRQNGGDYVHKETGTIYKKIRHSTHRKGWRV